MSLVVLDEQIAPKVATSLAALGYAVEHVSMIQGLGTGTADKDILKFCGASERALITLDYKMYTRPQQRELIKAHKVGVFFIRSGSKDVLLPPDIVELILHHWDAIDDIVRNAKRPFTKRLQPRCRMMEYETKKQRRKQTKG